MGFLSNLKNAVTGGAATVQVEVGQAVRGQAMPFRVHATAKADAQVNGVYLLVRAVESAELKDTDWEGGKAHREIVRGRKVSWEQRVPVSGGGQLQNGQQYHWEGSVQLPANVGPSFQGHMIRHIWEVQAGLDMPGNDPDSGWVPVDVR